MGSHPAVYGAFGLLIGFVGSLVGVGGGFLMVPYFTLVLRWPHATAVGTSLSIIVANAFSGVIGFARQRRIDFLVGTVLGLSTIPGTFFGKLVGDRVAGGTFKIVFGAVIAVAAYMLVFFRAANRSSSNWFHRGVHRTLRDGAGETYDYSMNLGSAAVASVGLGFVSTLLGVGGGFIHVPLLILVYGVPAHVAMATSHFVLVMTAIVGAVEYAASNDVNWTAFVWMGLFALLGAQAGVRLSAKLGGRTLRRVLAGVLLCIAGLMIWSGLRRGSP